MPTSRGDYDMLAFQQKIIHLRRQLALALCPGQKAQEGSLIIYLLGHHAPIHLCPPTGWCPFPLWLLLPGRPQSSESDNLEHLLNIYTYFFFL